MDALYHIQGWTPSPGMSCAGFSVLLFPEWKVAIVDLRLTQESVNSIIERIGRSLLDDHGYDGMFDPDNCGYDADQNAKPGPNARKMYTPGSDLRVMWGEWGPEHITVPGNACGLDLNDGISAPPDGRALSPHNVDTIYQASLLLTIFLHFANSLVCDQLSAEYDNILEGD